MATVQQWGRKESIIWPPHGYVYTLGAFIFACILTCTFKSVYRCATEEWPTIHSELVRPRRFRTENMHCPAIANRERQALVREAVRVQQVDATPSE